MNDRFGVGDRDLAAIRGQLHIGVVDLADRFGVLDVGRLLVEGPIEIEHDGEPTTIGLNFDWLTEAKLVLTDDLIREMLRQKKASGAIDETDFDEIETEVASEED